MTVYYGWRTSRHVPWRMILVSDKIVLVNVVVFAVGFALLATGRRRVLAAGVLAAYAAVSWALVNPLYRGLGPLEDDPLVRAMTVVAAGHPGAKAQVYGSAELVALTRASGMQSLGGVTFYPDAALMERLAAPGQSKLWNNYVRWQWVADPTLPKAQLRQLKGTRMEIRVDPCQPELLALGASWALSETPLSAPCLTAVDTVTSGKRTTYRYEIRP